MKTRHTLLLQRTYGAEGTNGTIIYHGNPICHTIELPWRNNLQRLSCIPAGTYKLRKHTFARHGEQIGIVNVLQRDRILIHTAADARAELTGGIAPVTSLTGEGKGTGSGEALAKLKALVYCLWDMECEVFLLIR